jgi:hypothetical protein
MLENRSYQNRSNPPRLQDQQEGQSNSIAVLMRNTLTRLSEFLSRLSVGAYVGVIIGVIGILLYTGYRLGQSGKTSLPTSTAILKESGEKVAAIVPDTQTARALQEMIAKYSQLEAQIKERDNVVASLRNEIKELQSTLGAERDKNAVLLTPPDPSETTISELQKARLSLPRPLRHKGVQMQSGAIIAPKG